MVGEAKSVAVTRVFSFGMGQKDPRTGESLAGAYVVITAHNSEMCRDIMLAVFGRDWSMEYRDVKDFLEKNNDSAGRRNLREHARFTFWSASPHVVGGGANDAL